MSFKLKKKGKQLIKILPDYLLIEIKKLIGL